MNRKCRTFSTPSPATLATTPAPRQARRPAMTLVEVVGGLALLATLLVGVLLAQGRYTRQAAAADRRLHAIAAADALLTSWRLDPHSLPRSGTGVVAGDSQLTWRTQTVLNPSVNELEAEVVR